MYSGTGLRGYGKLVIIKHDSNYLSAYAHNRQLLVKEGETVEKGQKIAELGSTDSDRPKLHFEIRRQGKPVDLANYFASTLRSAMYDSASPDDNDSQEPDLPPELEAFHQTPAPSFESEFLSDVTQLYLNEIRANRLLTAEEELALSRRVREGDFKARQTMIERNLRLVVNIAKHYLNRGIPPCSIWWRRATWASSTRLRSSIPNEDSAFHLRHLVDQAEHRAGDHESVAHDPPAGPRGQGAQSGARAQRSVEAENGVGSNLEEIARRLDKRVEDVRAILALSEHTASLDAPLDIDPSLSIGESLADDRLETLDDQVHCNEVESLIEEWIDAVRQAALRDSPSLWVR